MQHTGPEKGHREGQNIDKECADGQRCMWGPSKNMTLDTKEYHEGTEAVRPYNRFVNQHL